MAGRGPRRSAGNGKQLQNTTIKVRLYPTPGQAELMEKTFGCCRWLWNRMLADAREFYAATDEHYIPTPAHYKNEAPFLREVDSQPLCTVHQGLRNAFLDFFRAPKRFGYPQFKTKKARRHCHSCGRVNETLTTRDRRWRCPVCGASITREINAAQNIRDFGLARFREQNKETSAA